MESNGVHRSPLETHRVNWTFGKSGGPRPGHEPRKARYTCCIPRSLSHDPRQACYTCYIPRSLSHDPKQARYTCNLPIYFVLYAMTRDKRATHVIRPNTIRPRPGHDPRKARYTCCIPRSLSHDPKQARYTCNLPRSLCHDPR